VVEKHKIEYVCGRSCRLRSKSVRVAVLRVAVLRIAVLRVLSIIRVVFVQIVQPLQEPIQHCSVNNKTFVLIFLFLPTRDACHYTFITTDSISF
jgi:hypothetical protein